MIDRENVISGLQFTVAMVLFDPATGDSKDPDDLNAADRTTYDACVGAIALLKEQEAKVMNAQFAEMTFKNGNSMFLNTEYITSYGYLKDRDETAVSVLSEAKEIYFPGNQTAEIRSAFNRINEDRR